VRWTCFRSRDLREAQGDAGARVDARGSELIYETCKTYLTTQGKFILLLEVFIGFVSSCTSATPQLCAGARGDHSGFSLLGIAGSYGVAWFGIRVNTFANSRTAFASLRGKPIRATQFRSAPA